MKKHIENTIENPITANSVRNNDGDSIIDGGVCFWVTGHSMGAGVANLVAANLIDNGYKDNVYCYTFAAPNTFYLTDNGEERQNKALQNKVIIEDYKELHGVKYRCIFNMVNADDFVPEVPMKDCNWTKYGRTASISFNANIPIKTIQPRMDETLTNTERFIYVEYKGNREIIKDIVDSFNLMFEDNPDNMRYDAYVFNNDYVLAQMYLTEPNIPLNTKPFQKREMINSIPGQYQMPAYFMQYLAYSMHGGFPILIWDNTDIGFAMNDFAKRFYEQKRIIKNNNSFVKKPHYLETYYLITKNINTIDFY